MRINRWLRTSRRPGSPHGRWRTAFSLLVLGATVLAGVVAAPSAAGASAAGPSDPSVPGPAAVTPGPLSLTFDDGPSAYTPRVLDLLAQHGVTATFCLVGTQARSYPDLVRRIVADGHALCNHSMNHDDLATLPPEQVRADLTAADAAIRQAVPEAAIPYFRAPYGSWGSSAAIAQELGMSRLGWTVDPRDWSRPGADAIVQEVLAQARPDGIMLLHDGGGNREQTVQALSVLLPRLQQDGWTFRLPPVRPAS